jgi:hypothetical protein
MNVNFTFLKRQIFLYHEKTVIAIYYDPVNN